MAQAQQLRSLFPGCKLEVGRRKLVWCYDIQPTAMSRYYTVKIKYGSSDISSDKVNIK